MSTRTLLALRVFALLAIGMLLNAGAALACTSDADCTNPSFRFCIDSVCSSGVPECLSDTDCMNPSFPMCVDETCVPLAAPQAVPALGNYGVVVAALLFATIGFAVRGKREGQ